MHWYALSYQACCRVNALRVLSGAPRVLTPERLNVSSRCVRWCVHTTKQAAFEGADEALLKVRMPTRALLKHVTRATFLRSICLHNDDFARDFPISRFVRRNRLKRRRYKRTQCLSFISLLLNRNGWYLSANTAMMSA
jgi:hypothetical protein